MESCRLMMNRTPGFIKSRTYYKRDWFRCQESSTDFVVESHQRTLLLKVINVTLLPKVVDVTVYRKSSTLLC